MVKEREISFSSLPLVSLDQACPMGRSFDQGGSCRGKNGGEGGGDICDQTPLSIVRPGFQYGEACSMGKALDFREHSDYSLGREMSRKI